MKHLKSILIIAILAFTIASCSKNDDPITVPVESKKVTNLYAPAQGQGKPTGGAFIKFSFKEGKKVTGDNWDIAFRATEIIVNGGAKIGLPEELARTGNASIALVSNATFASVQSAPVDSEFKKDADKAFALPWGSNKGWYSYRFSDHKISPIGGKVIVIKTIDGNYAKMEIKNYYKDSKFSLANQRYYTFDYVYNPNKGDKNLK